jgi:hypothetical protein
MLWVLAVAGLFFDPCGGNVRLKYMELPNLGGPSIILRLYRENKYRRIARRSSGLFTGVHEKLGLKTPTVEVAMVPLYGQSTNQLYTNTVYPL